MNSEEKGRSDLAEKLKLQLDQVPDVARFQSDGQGHRACNDEEGGQLANSVQSFRARSWRNGGIDVLGHDR